MKKHRHTLIVISAIVIIVFTLCKCIYKNKPGDDLRGDKYAGSAKCGNCHKSIHDSYFATAHNKTSRPATKAVVAGSFDPNKNAYFYRPHIKVVMEQRDSGLFQVAYMNNLEKQASRFDIAIGSGRKAQTYLYWMGNNAYQLPISYFVPANGWVNSPGYPPHQVRFDRNIPIGCFECHSSYIKLELNEVVGDHYINSFDKNRIVYGIDCERCHGPAASHVTFHEEHPQEKKTTFITAFSSLSRNQKVDMCAVCHSGIQETLKSTFDFKPGDTLTNHFYKPAANVKVEDLDVHGNQKQLMSASECFIKSNTLNCTSCHNTHTDEKENMALFSKRCMNCHSTANHNFCTVKQTGNISITTNCIDCHMPAKPSKIIRLLSNGKSSPTPNLVRTHFISIYPEETLKFWVKSQ